MSWEHLNSSAKLKYLEVNFFRTFKTTTIYILMNLNESAIQISILVLYSKFRMGDMKILFLLNFRMLWIFCSENKLQQIDKTLPFLICSHDIYMCSVLLTLLMESFPIRFLITSFFWHVKSLIKWNTSVICVTVEIVDVFSELRGELT